jgi:membrane fusion protein, multidrug efflux system
MIDTVRRTLTAVAAPLALGIGGCSKPSAERTPPVPVQVAAAMRISAPVTVSANGVVEPLQAVSVQAQVGGMLDAVGFREGDDVQAGQVLFRLDPRPIEAALRQAEATLARDRAQAENAQRDADRYRVLVEKDYVTKAQADQADASSAALQATVLADRAAVDNVRLNLNYATIRAPITGRTGRLLVRRGNLVRANAEPLVVINQLRPILVRFPIVQQDFPALQRRAARGGVTVRISAADSSRVGEDGALAFLDNTVDSLTGTVTAKARFANAANVLWPGEYVRVDVELEVQPEAIAVPTRAVLPGQDGSYVFVIGADSKAQVRPIAAGHAVGELTVVTRGLGAGEQVVVDGQSRLAQGMTVEVKSAAPRAAAMPAAVPGAGATP